MEQALQQMLAERLGIDASRYEALQKGDLSALAGGIQDPLWGAMLASLLRRQEEEAQAAARPDPAQVLERAKRIIRELKNQLAAVDVMLRYIGETFGACPACWGQNRLCARCHGQGRPGSSEPSEQELLAWVEPALERLNLRIEKRQ